MKKFKFALDSVLSYKQQVLDALKGEHAAILTQVREQEEAVEAAWQSYRQCDGEYRQRKAEGITITDAMVYQNGLRAAEQEIQRETKHLEELEAEAEKRREAMVEAKKETSSIEKLREKKLDAYHKAEAKSEEAFIEEFVSTMRVNAANA